MNLLVFKSNISKPPVFAQKMLDIPLSGPRPDPSNVNSGAHYTILKKDTLIS